MQALETLVITSFALLAIFAAVPVVLQQIYYYQGVAETRAVTAFFNSLADSLESDMGAAFAQRILRVPDLRFGSLKYINETLGTCNGKRIFNTTFVYESPYLSAFGMYRGADWNLTVRAPDSPIAVRGWGTIVSMAPRVAKYGNIAVVYNITYTAARGATGAFIYYNLTSPIRCDPSGLSLQDVSLEDVSDVLVINVRIELR